MIFRGTIDTEYCLELFGGESINKECAYGKTVVRTAANAYCSPNEILPRDIYKKLDKYIFGQEKAKKAIAVVLYQHLVRYKKRLKNINKSNLLLIGPSGSGKTHISKTMANVLDLPFVRFSATNLVEHGYRGGMHHYDIISALWDKAGSHRSKARYGIIFIDEIDKLATCRDENSLATVGVQKDLLSLVDGTCGRIYNDQKEMFEDFDASNILFIFGGTFNGLSHPIEYRELIDYGLMPEFANRLGSTVYLERLSSDLIKNIIRKEINDYSNYISLTDSEINAYTEIVHALIERSELYHNMGARCVAPAVREFFEEKLFNIK